MTSVQLGHHRNSVIQYCELAIISGLYQYCVSDFFPLIVCFHQHISLLVHLATDWHNAYALHLSILPIVLLESYIFHHGKIIYQNLQTNEHSRMNHTFIVNIANSLY